MDKFIFLFVLFASIFTIRPSKLFGCTILMYNYGDIYVALKPYRERFQTILAENLLLHCETDIRVHLFELLLSHLA